MKSTPSRREQILAGRASPPERLYSGMNDRRRARRALPPIGLGRPAVGSRMARTRNVSDQGLAVFADVTLDVGDSVPVKFAGRGTVGARIAWKQHGLIGLALAPGFIGQGDE